MTSENEDYRNDDVVEDAETAEVAAEESAATQADLVDEAEKIVAEAAETVESDETAEAVEAEVVDTDSLAAAAAEALEKVQAEVAEWKDKYVRLHAEWDTYRRRTEEQRKVEKALATEKLCSNILPVLDDFERTIDYAEKNGEAGLLDGVKAVQNKLHDVLGKSGLERIDPAGEPFDALQHQAVATVPDEEAFDETVRQVYQKGYKMGSKVLRPAMVTVTTGGPQRPKPEDEG